jgi:hypothetical protein
VIRYSMQILLGILFLAVFAEPSTAETRVALVIGNGAYQNVPRLITPVADATDVSAALTRDGFDIILSTDLNKAKMEEAIIRFARAARLADVAMFYYSGHALQFGGVNYLAPVDAKLTDEADLHRLVRLDEVITELQQAKNLRIVVLDSCRDNPLADQLRRSIGTTRAVPLQRGLAKIDTPLGMIVAYSTQAGQTADDGDGRNSPYTSAFLKHIEEQEEIGTIFRQVSEDVYAETKKRQLPELSLSIVGRFYLRGKVEVSIKSDAPALPVPVDTARPDFEAAERVNTAAGWDAFLMAHPEGFYATLARERKRMATMTPAAGNAESKNEKADKLTTVLSSPKEEVQQSAPRPTEPPTSVLAVGSSAIARLLQEELRRVGCQTASITDDWSFSAQHALAFFNEATGTQFDPRAPGPDALAAVKAKQGRVCKRRNYETCEGPFSTLLKDKFCMVQ